MLISLNVVRMAAVFCASSKRRATVRRRGVIGTTRSLGPATVGLTTMGTGARGGDGTGAAGIERAVSARSTSNRSMRPAGPEAATSSGPRFFSAIIRRMAGEAFSPSPLVGPTPLTVPSVALVALVGVAALAAWGGEESGAGAGGVLVTGAAEMLSSVGAVGTGEATVGVAPVSISAITSPTRTVAPAW